MIIKYDDLVITKTDEGKARVIYNDNIIDWNEDSSGNWIPSLNGERVYFGDVPDIAESYIKDNALGKVNDPDNANDP